MFRCDRLGRIGGGCAVWVRNNLPCIEIPVSPPFELESVFLFFPRFKVLLFVLYVPPLLALRGNSIVSEYITKEVDRILLQRPECDVILCGDLNRLDTSLLCQNLTLVNLHNKPTYGNAELDYILLSESVAEFYNVDAAAPLDVSKVPHASLLACPKYPSNTDGNYCIIRKVFDLRKSHVQRFIARLNDVVWNSVFHPLISLDEKCEEFHNIFSTIAHESIPVSYVQFTAKDKPWITPVVKSLINDRWEAFRRGDLATFNHLKFKVKREIKKAKICWTKKARTTNIWKAVNANLGTRQKNPIDRLIRQFDSVDTALTSINHALSSHFQAKTSAPPASTYTPGWNLSVDESMVLRLLQQLETNKASFDVPNTLYKEAGPLIAKPLAQLFSLSISQRYVPAIWKTAAVTPIPKVTKPTINDIRPISILPTPAKILEKIVLQDMEGFFSDNFDAQQFGFRTRSSTLCALLYLEECVTRLLDDVSTAGVAIISYDLSKAFDKLPHERILQRLVDLGFPTAFIEWTTSYLHERKQFVRYGEHCSYIADVTSGVPQGSIIGPSLFVNTIGSYQGDSINCHVIKYADDTTLCIPIFRNDISGSLQRIRQEHDRILRWSTAIGLPINPAKSKCLTIKKVSSCPQPEIPHLPVVDVLRILGVTFNSKWNYNAHIDNISSIASKRLYALRVLKPSLSTTEMIQVYNSLIRSHFEYCAPLFLGLSQTNKQRLEKLQRRFHTIICGKSCRKSCLVSLQERRQLLSLTFLQRVMCEDHVLHHFLPTRMNSGRFRLPPRRTT